MQSDAELLAECTPEAKTRLDGNIDPTNSPDKTAILAVIVRTRKEGIVTVTRADIEQRLGDTGTSESFLRNQLQDLVEYGVLSVDTTHSSYIFTLAVPVEQPALSLSTWLDELNNFTPTQWEHVTPDPPTHADLDAATQLEIQATSRPDWLTEQLPQTNDQPHDQRATREQTPQQESPTDNPYVSYVKTAGWTMIGAILTATMVLVPLGYPRLAIGALFLALAAFSAMVPLASAAGITKKWTNPANIHPRELLAARLRGTLSKGSED